MFRHTSIPSVFTIALTTLITLCALTKTTQADITAQQVNSAIEKGVKFLRAQQKEDGSYPDFTAPNGAVLFPNGVTSLTTLALLNCGYDGQDQTISKALKYIRSAPASGTTYVVSLQLMVFCQAEPQKDKLHIKRLAEWLVGTQTESGGWGYLEQSVSSDPSNSQFALLALYEAERQGILIPNSTWTKAEQYWTSRQAANGGWNYDSKFGAKPSISMTCAGVASLVVTRGKAGKEKNRITNGQVNCCGDFPERDAVDRGMIWLSRNIKVGANASSSAYYYQMYCIERVGRLTGTRFIGATDWYRMGCEHIVGLQDQLRGNWRGSLSHGESNPMIASSFALLFLAKGRRPIAISKLAYGEKQQWNQHPQDLQNLVMQTEKRWDMYLTWQTLELKISNLSDLMESPVLFLSGKGPLSWTPKHRDLIKEYVNQGGFLFVENACGDVQFDQEFRQAMDELFPDNQLDPLPPDHAIWFADQNISPEFIGKLHGIQSCCRTSIVYATIDLGCYWELHNPRPDSGIPDSIQQDIQDRLAIGTNVLTYATNRQLKEKLERPQVAFNGTDTTSVLRKTLQIPKISHPGGSNDAPNALNNLLASLQKEAGIRVSVGTQVISLTDSLERYPILFFHGRRTFQWSAAERQALKIFVQNGGFIFGDSICASPQFTESFRREMRMIFPEQILRRLPADHAMFTNDFGGFDVGKMTLRSPATQIDGQRIQARESSVTPLVEGLLLDGRLAVAFSPFDLSCALENQNSLECKGYLQKDAAKLGTNIVIYALQQ